MCAKLYLKGDDGSAKGNYISFFIVIMKGEYDQWLPWPFKEKVSMRLMNQITKDTGIERYFLPYKIGNVFDKPKTDENLGIGYARFVPIKRVENDPRYVANDTMILNVKVTSPPIIDKIKKKLSEVVG